MLNGLARFSPVATVVFAFCVQVVAVIVFIARMDSQVTHQRDELTAAIVHTNLIAADLNALIQRIDRLDTPLSRQVKDMVGTLNLVHDQMLANTGQLNEQARDINRIEERLSRIVGALDSNYNQLQEHLRNHK